MNKRKKFILLLLCYVAIIAVAAWLFSLPGEPVSTISLASMGDFINFLIVLVVLNIFLFLLIEFYFFQRGLFLTLLLPVFNFILAISITWPLLGQFRFLTELDEASGNYFLLSLAYISTTIVLLRLFYPKSETVKDYK